MTCNQLMTLLEIYRSGDLDRIRCGTTADDLDYLFDRGLIRFQGGDVPRPWSMTEYGTKRIQAILSLT